MLYVTGLNSLVENPEVIMETNPDVRGGIESEVSSFTSLLNGDTLEFDIANFSFAAPPSLGPPIWINPTSASLYVTNAAGTQILVRQSSGQPVIPPQGGIAIDFDTANAGSIGASITWDAVNKQVVIHANDMYYFRVRAQLESSRAP